MTTPSRGDRFGGLRVLRKLEKYEILEEIGHGGMATVYRARDARLDRLVALKVMHPHLRGAKEARARFVREARSVARLKHPNILSIYDNSEEDSEESYIVTELLTGPTLKEFAEKNQPIPAEVAAAFTIELARALGAAHAAGIIHRDVKPENALLHENRCVKLTDFGIAQMLDSQSFTATGQILGSPGHMSPEQIEGADCDERSDIFSLGTVLYYLSTGKLPFPGKNPPQILKRIVDGDFVDPLRIAPAIGGRFRAIVVKALARNRDERYPSAEAFERDLVAFVSEIGIEDSSVLLADFLADPAAVRERLRARIIDKLSLLGEKAASAGDVPTALDHFNRVLALDESNPRVLKLLDRIGTRARQRSRFIGIGIGLALFGGCAIAYAVFAPPPGPPVQAARDAGETIAMEDAAVVDATVVVLARDAAIAPEVDAALVVADASVRPPARDAGVRVVARDPRIVHFDPYPEDVSISVDGSAPRRYGPDFHAVELAPGTHSFRFSTENACCEDVTFNYVVPPGEGELRVERTLPFRPCLLYVASNVPADVVVGDGEQRGRARTVIEVPVERPEEARRITVTAEGHRAYTDSVRLRAGAEVRVDVELEPMERPP